MTTTTLIRGGIYGLGIALLSAGCASEGLTSEEFDAEEEAEGVTSHEDDLLANKSFVWTDERNWDSNTIPYVLDNLADSTREKLERVFEHYHANTQITFVKRKSESEYLTIGGGTVCSWTIATRRVTIAEECSFANITHEIGHALGMGHTQRRSDVDDHIYVEAPGGQWGDGSGTNHGPFDIYSVMLSAHPSWKLDGTPVPKSSGLSTRDVRTINWLYNTRSPTTGIKADNNRWISSNNGNGEMAADRTRALPWEKFEIYYLSDGNVGFRCNNGRWVSSENGGSAITCNRTKQQSWERFFLNPANSDGEYNIRCNNGKFLRRSGNAGGLFCIGEDGRSARELFTVHRLDVSSP